MLRTVLAVAAITIGVTAVAAQSDPIAARKALMKDVGAQTKTGGGMAKGEVPYDQAKAQGILAVYVDAAAKLPTYSRRTPRPAAIPRRFRRSGPTWPTSRARYEKFGAEAKAAQSSVKDLDSFKAAFPRTDQELRRLPRDLSGQEELTFSDRPIEGGRPL